MIVNANKLIPEKKHESFVLRVLSNAFARFVIYLATAILVLKSTEYFFEIFTPLQSFANSDVVDYFRETFIIILLFAIYYFLIRVIEKRPVYELSLSMIFTEILAGIICGSLIILLVVGILAIPGYYSVVKFNSADALIHGFFSFVNGAFFEELLFRLIIFKLMEEYFGSWLSLLFSALIFGAAHLFNQNATVWSAFAIAVEAGVLLTLAFMFTRRIWMAFGIHFGWNFFQASVFGLPASGLSFPGLITSELSGPVWITGGNFGVEASPITLVLGLILSFILLKKVLKDDQVILPSWHKRKRTEIKY